jgi:hypothetical protein
VCPEPQPKHFEVDADSITHALPACRVLYFDLERVAPTDSFLQQGLAKLDLTDPVLAAVSGRNHNIRTRTRAAQEIG